MKTKKSNQKIIFSNKAIFFPEKKILAVGDIHLGLENSLIESGIFLPETEFEKLKNELQNLIKKFSPAKIIFVGDIQHSFSYKWKEKNYFSQLFEFLKKYFSEKNIIFIKGNHDTMDYSFEKKFKNYFFSDGIFFIHGHEKISEKIFEKAKTIVVGHLHPAIILQDKSKIKKEKFKCFLSGNFKKKKIFILPSFFSVNLGTPINLLVGGGGSKSRKFFGGSKEKEKNFSNKKAKENFSIISKSSLKNFQIHIIGKNKIYNFGKVKEFLKK